MTRSEHTRTRTDRRPADIRTWEIMAARIKANKVVRDAYQALGRKLEVREDLLPQYEHLRE